VFAFILRPFGIKRTIDLEIDFDQVERELVMPALSMLGASSRTWSAIDLGGIISPLELESLLASDVVLADLSAPNSRVFYELGLAHALREKRTILMAASSKHMPFDVVTSRYLRYDPQNASASIQQLFNLLQAVIQSDRIDSPVYTLLPGLQPPRAAGFPQGFSSELEAAERAQDLGHLRLLSQEVRTFHWAAHALKQVGERQFFARDLIGTRETLEYLLSLEPGNIDANLRLGTVYQRLNEPRRSDEAIKRALELLAPGTRDRSEALALLGRNAKAIWLDTWRSLPQAEWRTEALRCRHLKEAYDYYLAAFKQDLNNYYCGLNALALGTVAIELAGALPEVWTDLVEDDTTAMSRLSTLRREIESVAAGVTLSIQAAGERQPEGDVWLDISRADCELLTSNRPERVAAKYRRAIPKNQAFVVHSALAQIYIYRDLGVLEQNTRAAIEAIRSIAEVEITSESPAVRAGRKALLFVGHAIDTPDRAAPRFPASSEPLARNTILRAVEQEVSLDRAAWVGVAGASSGGDILFHEACELVGIAVKICLAVPAAEYARVGVVDAGSQWETRFRDLIARHPYQVLSDSTELPGWLRSNAPYDFRGRDIMWRYQTAATIGDITVIALWDGRQGATADFVRMAKERGAKVVVLDAVNLFGLDTGSQAAPQ
jgi:hypothetical protein